MSTNSSKAVRKGKSGERDFIKTLYRLTKGEIELKRNLKQARDGGDDLQGFRNFSIEIKRWKRVSDALVRDWWAQCQRNAQKTGKVPVLAYRADQQGWKVVMHPNKYFKECEVQGCLTMDVELFARYLLDPENTLPMTYH